MKDISKAVYNVNVASEKVIITPEELKKQLPLTTKAGENVVRARAVVDNILDGKDPRLMIVIGPCSIHDMQAAYEYAEKLKELSAKVDDCLYLIMRVYFEKPRTTVGWKGLINDPGMDDSFDINKGLKYGRKLLLDLAEMDMPTATEALNAIVPQYVQDLICWTAIGARTTESQTHREMSSGLSTAVGFKNGTDGNLTVAINALESALHPHSFLGINNAGQVAVLKTKGNTKAHIVLRGGGGKTNFDSVSVAHCESELKKNKLKPNIMIDASHANSGKNHKHQPLVVEDVMNQVLKGNKAIIGLMIESNLHEGNQSILADKSKMKYGVSVTDACIDWKTTEKVLLESAAKLREIIPQRNS
ncbi:MAG: 3-deoxy-7-phosphoheptulonate synthase [Gammaproteobacteria bacterium]|nr:3-deoxy-7-phosphoheptulonate synthase [Gammaproteobacteria bacterium]